MTLLDQYPSIPGVESDRYISVHLGHLKQDADTHIMLLLERGAMESPVRLCVVKKGGSEELFNCGSLRPISSVLDVERIMNRTTKALACKLAPCLFFSDVKKFICPLTCPIWKEWVLLNRSNNNGSLDVGEIQCLLNDIPLPPAAPAEAPTTTTTKYCFLNAI